LDLIKLPVPGDFYCAVVHPRLVVSTKEARSILPKQVPMHDAIAQWGNVGGLVAGLYSGNIGLIGRAMKDSIAEPYRKGFIPGFDDLREKILSHGSLAMNIAGSGPSVFALANRREIAVKAGAIMDEHFSALGIDHHCYVVKVSNRGARLTAY
jgi:homoserine kinase